ncbi:MAG TPA: murein biosynthesis integral membrane protein MurJ [Gaiellaceae bacterium]|nr:murein biosynthesis integral membrane protein MurJ [Gaiellaceae bacterium]
MSEGGQARRLARSTATFTLATGLSRALGLVREIVAAYFFGVSGKINAFTVASQIPSLTRAFVGDAALSGAFVPVFSELLAKEEKARAWRVASTIFWLVLIGVSLLTAVLILIAPLLILPFGDPGGDPELAVQLTRIMLPIVGLVTLSGIVVGILNAYDQFTIPALAPVAWNLVIIGGLVAFVPLVEGESEQLIVYAVATLVAALVQLLLPVPWLRRLDGRIRPVIDWRDPAVKRFFVLMLPVTLTLGLININIFVDMLFASRLVDPELAPAAIEKAFRVYMLPQGMFSVAVVTVLFPTLSRFAAVGNLQAYRATVDGGLRQIAFLLVPAALVGAVLAQPIVRLLYERGAFTADNTVVVAQCLAAFSLGLTFNGWMLLLSRGFYSLQRNWVPTAVALGTVALNAVLDALLYRLGVWGIPLATSLVNIAGVGILLAVMRRSPGLAGARGVLVSVVRILAASALAAAAAYGVWWALDELLGRDLWAQIVSLGAGLAAGGAVYLAAARLLGVRELEALRALRRGRHGD